MANLRIFFSLFIVVCAGVPTLRVWAFGSHPSVAAVAPVSGQTIWITHADGTQSCSALPGQTLEEGAVELKKMNVRILDSRKGDDGMMHMHLCGAPTGKTNAYLIPAEDLSLARGYQQAK